MTQGMAIRIEGGVVHLDTKSKQRKNCGKDPPA